MFLDSLARETKILGLGYANKAQFGAARSRTKSMEDTLILFIRSKLSASCRDVS